MYYYYLYSSDEESEARLGQIGSSTIWPGLFTTEIVLRTGTLQFWNQNSPSQAVPVFLKLGNFPGHETFSAKTGKAPYKQDELITLLKSHA